MAKTDWDEYLTKAALNGDFAGVKEALANGANIHKNAEAALRWATVKGRLDIVIFLVENGANIHARNNWVLREAAKRGHTKVVNYLKAKIAEEKAEEEELAALKARTAGWTV